ncbi:MAG: DNA-3-methyladenine glycosylase [Anaerolineales bacterium]|nr:MAG: DNA-3-methyladenine glycosylase [Anaerolineales bacterium]
MNPRLSRSFFNRPTLAVARDLLGQRLVRIENERTRLSGIICETEAYIGPEDDGCHAKSGLTERNRSMWGRPGICYVYFTYGMHWMLNLVTENVGFPAAVLLRAVIPQEGIEHIRRRRAGQASQHWTDGPAKLCQAFGINAEHNGLDSCHPQAILFVEQAEPVEDEFVTLGPRVGLNRVEEPWKSMPWRFRVSAELFTNRGGFENVTTER